MDARNPYFRVTIALAVVASCLCVGYWHWQIADSVTLVKSMRLHHGALAGARFEIVQSVPNKAERIRFLECTENADLSPVAELIAGRLDRILTRFEIGQAVSFFESKVGRKWLRRDSELMESTDTFAGGSSSAKFTNEELSEIVAFSRSRVGVKLLGEKAPVYGQLDELNSEIDPLIKEIIVNCARVTLDSTSNR